MKSALRLAPVGLLNGKFLATKSMDFPAMTARQLAALKNFIAVSKDATEFARKAIIWMIDQSDRLTVPVALSIDGSHQALAEEVACGAHDMNSSHASTRIGLFLDGMGSPMFLYSHEGCYVGSVFDVKAKGLTTWLSPELFSEELFKPEVLSFDIEAIRAVKLEM